MSDYLIITDSTADLPGTLIADLGVMVIPMSFLMDGKDYLDLPDGAALSAKEFYDILRSGKNSSTSQVTEARFLEIFEPVLQKGQDILYIAFSSALSGTCFQGVAAANALKEQYPERNIRVVDSLCASMGEGLFVYHAVQKKRAGMELDALADELEQSRQKLCHWFTVDDLNHLKRGGRVSATAALVGTMLGIKPVLHVDDEGRLIPVSKVRGRKKSLVALVEEMEKTAENPGEQVVFISHGDAPEDAQLVADLVRNKFGTKEIVIGNIGPVIGSHSGPGTVALFFLGSHR